MPRPRFRKLERARQEAILLAAAEELAAHGYRGASLNRVLAEVGVSKGAFYYYFDDKADLFAAVFSWMDEGFFEGMDAALGSLRADTFWEQLAELSHRFLEVVMHKPWVVGVARAFYSLTEEERSAGAIGAYLADRSQWIDRLVARGQELGAVRDDLPVPLASRVAFAVGAVFDRWMFDRWEELDHEDVERLFHLSFDVMRRSLTRAQEDL